LFYKYFLSSCGLSFHFLGGIICSTKILISCLIYLFFCHLCLWYNFIHFYKAHLLNHLIFKYHNKIYFPFCGWKK
jgi:hypothetical protein